MPWGLERLSEKILELNFASQLNHRCGGTLLWFGLTQKQEAECGFDTSRSGTRTLCNNNFSEFWRLCESFHRKAFGIVQVKTQAAQP